MRSLRLQLSSALLLSAAITLGLLASVAVAQTGGLGVDPTDTGGVPQNQAPGVGDVLSDPAFETGVLLGVVTTLGVALVSLLFLGGTKFVTSENVLDNDSRRTIFNFIREHPGTHLRATAQALDLSTTNVLWHLRKLENANLVNSKKFEGYKVFYPTEGGQESRQRAIALAVLRNDNARDILAHIAAVPGTHQREIARVLNVNHGTIRWHLRKLNEAGLVVQVKKEHTSNYFLSDLGSKMLREVKGVTVAAPAFPALAASANPLAAPAAAVPAAAPAQEPKVEG